MVLMTKGPRDPLQALTIMVRAFTGNGGQRADCPEANAFRKVGGVNELADGAKMQREANAAKPAPEPSKPSFEIKPDRAGYVGELIRTKCADWETDLVITWKSADHAKVIEPDGDVRVVVIWKEGVPYDYVWPTQRVTQNGNVRLGNSCAVGEKADGQRRPGSMVDGLANHKADVGGQMCTN
ncbi:MAG: hypothetical protein AABW86_05995 [Candidatus Micrarchaeota archaeon]